MIAAHMNLITRLSPVQSLALWGQLHKLSLLSDPPDPRSARGEILAEKTSHLSHAEVVLAVASRSEPFWCDIVDKLLEKPVYMCARGETGIPAYDIHGNPLPLPIGHRRGEPVGSGMMPEKVYRRLAKKAQYTPKRDPRIITYLCEGNPKQLGSKSYDRFSLYKVGMTVSEYVALGGFRSDIVYDVEKGFIRVDLP